MSGARLEEVVQSVDPKAHPDPESFVRTCLAALGVFVDAGLAARLVDRGFLDGWDHLEAIEAQVLARAGNPVVATDGHHVALVVPSRLEGDVYLAQGGPTPRVRAPVSAAFGTTPPTYWWRG